MMLERGNLFVPSKMNYVRGKRPPVKCIFCAVRDRDKRVEKLEIFRTDNFIVSANLYPYNPGHIIIFPIRHIITTMELTKEEFCELFELHNKCLKALTDIYNPQGFNIGFNISKAAGASIEHLHMHIVPRYQNEIGFLDVLNNDRVIVEDPRVTVKKLSEYFSKSL